MMLHLFYLGDRVVVGFHVIVVVVALSGSFNGVFRNFLDLITYGLRARFDKAIFVERSGSTERVKNMGSIEMNGFIMGPKDVSECFEECSS